MPKLTSQYTIDILTRSGPPEYIQISGTQPEKPDREAKIFFFDTELFSSRLLIPGNRVVIEVTKRREIRDVISAVDIATGKQLEDPDREAKQKANMKRFMEAWKIRKREDAAKKRAKALAKKAIRPGSRRIKPASKGPRPR